MVSSKREDGPALLSAYGLLHFNGAVNPATKNEIMNLYNSMC